MFFPKQNSTTIASNHRTATNLSDEQLDQVVGGIAHRRIQPVWYVLESSPSWVAQHGASAGYDVQVLS